MSSTTANKTTTTTTTRKLPRYVKEGVLSSNRPNRHGDGWTDIKDENILSTRTRGIRVEYNEIKNADAALEKALAERKAEEERREKEKKAAEAKSSITALRRREQQKNSGNDKENKVDNVTKKMGAMQVDNKKSTTTTTTKGLKESNKPASGPKKATKLDDDVLELVKKLGAKPPKKFETNHKYRDQAVPAPISNFTEIAFPDGITYCSKEYDIKGLTFAEFVIAEWDSFTFLQENPDACLFGDAGDVILCTLLSTDTPQDFPVYILDERQKDAVCGPIRLSDFLKTLEKEEPAAAATTESSEAEAEADK
eukprot:GEZU01023825.1.p1 GENE.GEZU01023825.1~~GEZU01023825.1.p1  ORF type:complete len:334 (-),score=154.21 GEZU01023825.1:164-1093(-)